jgi:hypothetical protein
MKKEYSKCHGRYTELFKTHLDYMERTKSVLGTDKLEQLQQGLGASRPRIAGMALNQLNRSSGPVSFGYSELENNNSQQASILTDFASQTTPGVDKSAVTSLKKELKVTKRTSSYFCLRPSTQLRASGIGMTILHPPLPPTICNFYPRVHAVYRRVYILLCCCCCWWLWWGGDL